MDNVNHIEIVEWANGTYDFRITATENGNLLCSSHQGYENETDCAHIARRVTTAPVDGAITFTQEVTP